MLLNSELLNDRVPFHTPTCLLLCRKPHLMEDSGGVLVIDGVCSCIEGQPGPWPKVATLQPKQGAVSPGRGPNQGHL